MTKRLDNKMLLQLTKYIMLVVITLFSVVTFNVYAEAGHVKYAYSEFEWDKFREQRKFWWSDACNNDKSIEDEPEWCENVLKSEEEFYVRLYKILAKMDKEGFAINDEIILQAVFYGLTPSAMEDTGSVYTSRMGGVSPYNMDKTEDKEDPKVDIIVEAGPSVWDQVVSFFSNLFRSENAGGYEGDFYSNETDSLKALVQNMITYKTVCYGEAGKPVTKYDANNNPYKDCSDFEGTTLKKIKFSLFDENRSDEFHGSSGEWCVVENTYTMGYYKYFSSKWEHLWYKIGGVDGTSDWYGEVPVDDGFVQCQELDQTMPYGAIYEYLEDDDTHTVSTDVFFDFLKESKYFDRKAHLQYYYADVLKKAEVNCMTSDVCNQSLESLGFDTYQEYKELIRKDRLKIIKRIIQNLNALGYDITYDGLSDGEFVPQEEITEAQRKSNYWPIGSDETEERNGVLFADGDPASKNVIKEFGEDKNGVMHYGIDISGVDGVTNVISVSNGEVLSVYTGCSNGDKTCNDGYGNQIIIASSNGDYIVYGHMSDITVSVGDSVLKGQVIGHVGQTGDCDSPCLHWEIRVGGNDQEHAINPYQSISPSNPRPQDPSDTFPMHSTTLTREEFINKMVMYCNTHSCSQTFITYFVNNAGEVYDLSLQYGLNPEFTVSRALVEGLSPGAGDMNFWGIKCSNSNCDGKWQRYSSFAEGVKGLANLGIVKNYDSLVDVFYKGHYAWIGGGTYYWANPGNSGEQGGCYYFPYIKEYYTNTQRAQQIANFCNSGVSCNGKSCNGVSCPNGSSCIKITDDDQYAYSLYQIKAMNSKRYNIFGL